MGWKYVVLEDRLARYPIIFPDKLIHIEVFTVAKLILPERRERHIKPYSAGFIERLYVEHVGGESETMKMGSQPGDDTLINGYPYFHGIK